MSKYGTVAIDNTAYYLKNTFEFIQQYQVNYEGEIFETLLYLKINLLEGQIVGNNEARVSATNTVMGLISYVGETYVVILAKLSEDDIYSEYTVNYSNIIEVINYSIYHSYNLYRNTINNLPDICKSEEGKYLELYEGLKLQIDEFKEAEKYVLKIIFAGVASRIIDFNEIDIVQNLIIINKMFILPLTVINGFIITPKEIVNEKSNKGDE